MKYLRGIVAPIVWLLTWLSGILWRRSTRPLRTVVVDELPDRADPNVLYVIGEGDNFWFVAFKCPCGCKELIQLSLLADARPRWAISRHEDGTATIAPSIWRQVGCRSHFFIRRGRVQWCNGGIDRES